MPIVNIIKRASNYILGNDEYDDDDDDDEDGGGGGGGGRYNKNCSAYEDNEILFCKNNVCVHPPTFARQESDILHYPGYLTVTTKTFIDQYNKSKRPTLLLTWIPNATLRKCPSTVEQINTKHIANNGIFLVNSTTKNGGFLNNNINKSITTIRVYDKKNAIHGSSLSLNSNNTNPFLDSYIYNEPNNTIVVNQRTTNQRSAIENANELYNGDDRIDDISQLSLNFDKNNSPGHAGYSSSCIKYNNNHNTQNISSGGGNNLNDNGNGSGGSSGICPDDNHSHNGTEDDDIFTTSLESSTSNQQMLHEETADELQLKRELQPLLPSAGQQSTSNHNHGINNGNKNADGGVDNDNDLGYDGDADNERDPLDDDHDDVDGDDDDDDDFDDDGLDKISIQSKVLFLQKSVTSVNITIANPHIQNHDISPSESILQQNDKFIRTFSMSSSDDLSPSWMTPELFAYNHNLSFPDSERNSPIISRKVPCNMKCRRFSVDLSQMRSLRLFFNDEHCTSGQLVIASRESQYKILHFHHGGLDHLAQVLHQWHCLLHNIKFAPGNVGHEEQNLPYRQFMVCRPEVKKSELHPDEGNVNKITTDYFYGVLLNEKGQIEDDLLLRKCVFFGGLEKSLRKMVWPFLLHCYSFNSTFDDRTVLRDIRKQEYDAITRRRFYSMSPEEHANFWRNVQCVIEKDVVRTDRGNPFFAGPNNPNIEIMKDILLNYAYYNPGLSYTQGMSDLLAPVLCELKNESESFWCFVGLMQRAIFVCTPTDNDIDKNLNYLRELIRIMLPKFHKHLDKHIDAKELLFCHRWILLCFKREFTEAVAIRMWEACWSNYLTDYFHLFLCLAIIAVYADDVIAQDLRTDEMLLHFSSLAMYMDGQLILRKARGLLYQFRQLQKIPCTLSGLCKRCGPGMWDSGHQPAIECIGHTDDDRCTIAIDD